VALINGKLYDLFPLEPDSEVRDISPANETTPYVSQKACLTQANVFLVVQDGVSPAIVYDGSSSYRSENKNEYGSPSITIEECVLGANNEVIAVPNVIGIEPYMLVVSDSGAVSEGTLVTSFSETNSTITLNTPCTKTIVTTLKFYSPGVIKNNVSIPVGSIMAYGDGRLWVASENNLFAGDLVGTSSKSEIKFSETIYIAGGGSFYFNDKITGLVFLPGQDNSVGQGDLIVFTKSAIYAIKATNYDRTTWQQTPGMQRKIFIGRGSENQESIILTDKDIYFRSLEGMRSLAQTVNARGVVSFSDSLEASRILAYDTERWLNYAPGILFDSRYLLGASPKIQRITDSSGNYTGRFNIVFPKLISKDFNAGCVVNAPVPVFDGEWNGLQICKLVEGTFENQRRCFAITCDPDGKNCLYELTMEDYSDEIKPSRNSSVVPTPIQCSVETKRFSFGTPFDIKSLTRADIGFTSIYGDVQWNLEYCPDFVTSFYPVQSKQIPNEQVTPLLTTQSPPDLPFGFANSRTIKPTSIQVDLSKRLSNFGYMFQGKITWSGKAKLVLFRLHASRKDISDLGEC
jgi:hypothetical protein